MLEILRRMKNVARWKNFVKVRQYCNQIFVYAIATGQSHCQSASGRPVTFGGAKSCAFPTQRSRWLLFFSPGFRWISCSSPVTRLATNLLLHSRPRTIELRSLNGQRVILIMPCGQSPQKPAWKCGVNMSYHCHDRPLTFCCSSKLSPDNTGWFPGTLWYQQPMSEASINMVLKRIGYDGGQPVMVSSP